ncbi:MAG: DNA polymerase III subunit gamma/tau [Patescibacteria group bacterium]|jgi:DNA polymerase-3 subunit gamma/tau
MSFSLYRKYRPRTFAEVVGQESIIQTLMSQSKQRSFAHAYVFTGPRGVGKTTTARLLAKTVNAKKIKKDGDIDLTDLNVALIDKGKAIDIIEIDAASHTGVDHVRSAIIENSRTHPSVLPYKVFIIDEVHMLSASAFNALLKTLEEPPEHAIFILATTEVHKVPDTILSRCQRFSFQRIDVTHLIERLEMIAKSEKVKIDKDVLVDIAARAEGSSRDAESLLGQLMAFGHGHITREEAAVLLPRSSMQDAARFMRLVYARDRVASMEYINAFVEDGGNADEFLKDVIVFVRLVLLTSISSKKLDEYISVQVAEEVKVALSDIATTHPVKETIQLLDILLCAKSRYVYHDIPQLALEMVVSEFCAEDGSTQSPTPPSSPTKKSETPPTLFPQEKLSKKNASLNASSRKSPEVSFSILKEKWQDFTTSIRKVNRGLSISMQVARPVDINGTRVTLHVPYAFHKERIDMVKHRGLIEKEMSEYFGKQMTLVCEVSTGSAKQREHGGNVELVRGDKLWNQVLDAFGDKLAPSQD